MRKAAGNRGMRRMRRLGEALRRTANHHLGEDLIASWSLPGVQPWKVPRPLPRPPGEGGDESETNGDRSRPPTAQEQEEATQALVEGVEEKVDGQLRLLTLNVAHGRRDRAHQALLRNNTVSTHLEEIAGILRHLSPDVVALQEADGPSAWSGNFDHVETLAQLAELEAFYRGEHNPFSLGRYNLSSGTALLARLPLQDPESQRFGLSWRDTKGFVTATVQVPEWGGESLDVVSVHLDFLVPSARRKQIAQMGESLRERGGDRPLVVLGDLNSCWHREPRTMEKLTQDLGLQAFEPFMAAPTYPSRRPRRRLDWILISPQLRFSGYKTVPLPLSDHLGVVADISLKG